MNKTLVIYHSKYGHTKKYAEWLSEELGANIYNGNELNISILKDYSAIIVGSSLYAGSNKGARLIAKNFEQLRDKKVALFTVGMFDTNSAQNVLDINKELDKVITPEIREKIKIFHLRGGIDCENLSLPHKVMMKFAHSALSKKPESELTDGDKDFLEIYGKKIDFSDKKMLEPIVKFYGVL